MQAIHKEKWAATGSLKRWVKFPLGIAINETLSDKRKFKDHGENHEYFTLGRDSRSVWPLTNCSTCCGITSTPHPHVWKSDRSCCLSLHRALSCCHADLDNSPYWKQLHSLSHVTCLTLSCQTVMALQKQTTQNASVQWQIKPPRTTPLPLFPYSIPLYYYSDCSDNLLLASVQLLQTTRKMWREPNDERVLATVSIVKKQWMSK